MPTHHVGQQLKLVGMRLAAAKRNADLETARLRMVRLAQFRPSREVSADDLAQDDLQLGAEPTCRNCQNLEAKMIEDKLVTVAVITFCALNFGVWVKNWFAGVSAWLFLLLLFLKDKP